MTDRKKEVIAICLDQFVEKGLANTSTRTLSSAMQLQNAGLYYYFSNKDEAVIQCAEEAALRLERALISPVPEELWNPELMMENLLNRANTMAPTMQFLVSVCVSEQYKEGMQPVLDRLVERYDLYTKKIAATLDCPQAQIKPYVYMAISAIVNYMTFKEESLVLPQLELVTAEIRKLLTALAAR